MIQLLVADVAWTSAAADGDPDDVVTSFAFAPVASQSDVFAAWSAAAAAPQVAPAPPPNTFMTSFAADGNQSNEIDWERIFERGEQEQFRLLDVSSNADQMGVSFFWFNSDPADRSDLVFFRTFGVREGDAPTPAYPLQVRALDLSAEARFVRGFTLPQVSWEPLFNWTPGAVAGDPPPGFNLYPDDGGPTRLLCDSVELVPIAPLPVSEFLVRDFTARKDGFTGALFTLPFGLRAVRGVQPDQPVLVRRSPREARAQPSRVRGWCSKRRVAASRRRPRAPSRESDLPGWYLTN